MGLADRARRRLRILFRRKRVEAELDDEVGLHLEQETDDLIRQGWDRAAAEREARLRLGGVEQTKEWARDARPLHWLDSLWRDLRSSLRLLGKNRAYTLLAVATLAIGIGSNTAVFTVVDAVLLRPLPYRDSERLVVVWERSVQNPRDPVAPLNYFDWAARADSFENLAAYQYESLALTGEGQAEQLTTLAATANLFQTLGVNSLLGRAFTEEELARNEPAVVLGHRFWQQRFGSDPTVVGTAIELSNTSHTVVGVMEPGFEFPSPRSDVALYSPLILAPGERTSRLTHTLSVIGRLRSGVSVEEAAEELGAIARAIAEEEPPSNAEVTLVSAREEVVENVRASLLSLAGAVGFVLLITCANVAHLVMVRSSARSKEIALRTALGSSRGHILRQLMTENFVLAVLGGATGILLAAGLVRIVVRFGPASIPRLESVGLDLWILGYAFLLSIVTGLLFGLTPALHSSRSDLAGVLKTGAGVRSGRKRFYGHSALVVGEVGLSLVVLAGAGLMLQSFAKLQELDYGFRPENLLAGQIFLDQTRYPTDGSQFRPLGPEGAASLSPQASFFEELLDGIETLPGVEMAAAASSLPLDTVGIDFDLPIVIEGRPVSRPGEERQANLRIVTDGYFRTMEIPVLGGRAFTEFDGPASQSVMMINETMADQFFPDENPIGKRIVLYGRPREIVGVSGAVRHYGFSRDHVPEIILPSRQFQFGGMTLVVRTSVPPEALTNAVRSQVASIDRDQPVYRLQTMEAKLSESIASPRFTTSLLLLFAALAIAIVLVGIYGVFSYTVSERSHEIGIRMSLGARRHDVIAMVIGEGLRSVGLGVALGLAGALALGRLMQGLLFDVSATDPFTLAAVSAFLAVTALIAVYMPARRGTRIDPIVALRRE